MKMQMTLTIVVLLVVGCATGRSRLQGLAPQVESRLHEIAFDHFDSSQREFLTGHGFKIYRISNSTYFDTDGDGRIDREYRRLPEMQVTRVDTDYDGAFDFQFEDGDIQGGGSVVRYHPPPYHDRLW